VPIRRSSKVLTGVGVVLIVLAALVRFIVVPVATKLPGSTDQTVHYSGKATLLNSAALQSGDTAHALNANIPITVDRRLKVTATHGDTAIVKDAITIHAAGQTLPSAHVYAIDRTTMDGTSAPAGTSVEPSKGAISSAFPMGSKRSSKAYQFYDSTTRTNVPLTYTGHAKTLGRSVNQYKIVAAGPVKDPAVLASLPPGLPKALVGGLVPLLPAAAKAKFTPAATAALPATVPPTYTGLTNITASVDEQTGVAIEETINEQVIANAAVGKTVLPLLPVSAFDFSITPAGASDLADKATSAGRLLTGIKIIVPLVLLILGILLIVIAVLRRRRPEDAAPIKNVPDQNPGKLDGKTADEASGKIVQ
jgi:hypothetical protein